MSIRIEAVTPDTLEWLEAGLHALARDLNDPYRLAPAALERALFSDTPVCSGALTFDGEEMCGVALFSPMMSTAFGCPGVYVSDLWVAPDARGSGLGRRLLAHVARDAAALWGSGFLRLAAYDDNPRSIDFYQGLGFERVSTETALRLSGADFENLTRIA
ncbi:GNAT family N-acetyltransferase [Marivita sp.]|jgi:ribosomal protein S18 acetylase RimI-like enzyme|uniref:GNAT family N-acetyltransferase n=1 Tax=Marivita sp. TaxID=2003365 RepID=UPI003B5CEB72